MHWIYAHLIGDYLLQNDWMAKGKKEKSWICLVHVIVYLLPFLFCKMAMWKLALIGLQHFIQDRSNLVIWLMKVSGKSDFASPPMAPWSIIIIDNILHILEIAAIEGCRR